MAFSDMQSGSDDPSDGLKAAPLKVSYPLLVGVILLPPVFAWKLLNSQYAIRARLFTLAWLLLYILIFLMLWVGLRSKPLYSAVKPMPYAACQAYRQQLVQQHHVSERHIEVIARDKDPGDSWRICTPQAVIWVSCNRQQGSMHEVHFKPRFDDNRCN